MTAIDTTARITEGTPTDPIPRDAGSDRMISSARVLTEFHAVAAADTPPADEVIGMIPRTPKTSSNTPPTNNAAITPAITSANR